MKKLIVFLALCATAHAIGTVQQSTQNVGSNVYAFTFYWTGDAVSGSVPATVATGTAQLQGYRVISAETTPGSPAPTNSYSITLIDTAGVDILAGAGASLSSSSAQAQVASPTAPPLYGSFTFTLTGNSVGGAKGSMIVYLAPLSQVIGLSPTSPNFPAQGANLVYASPNGASGSPGFRAIAVPGDFGANVQGNGSKVQLSTGTTTSGDCAKFDAFGNTVDVGAPCNTSFPAGTQTQVLRLQPNTGNNTTTQFAALPQVNTADYNFPAYSCNVALSCVQGGTSLGSLAVGANTVTLAPCPLGLNGSDVGHNLYISGGTGAAESVPITGGTCTSGAASGTVIFTAANTHTGSWTIQSVVAGIPEALQAACSAGTNVVLIPAGSYTQFGQISAPCSNMDLRGAGADLTIITAGSSTNLNQQLLVSSVSNWTIEEITWDGNFINQTTGAGSLVKIVSNSSRVLLRNCVFRHSGVGAPAAQSFAGALVLDSVRNIGIIGNRFLANWGYEIQFITRDTTGQTYTGFQIIDNQFGSPSMTDSLSNGANYWDTYSGGQYSIISDGYSDMLIQGNHIYGAVKKALLGNPIMIANCRNCDINNNLINGLGNGTGTLAVTQSSGNITGTNTFFNTAAPSASDVGMFLQIEGDATLYQISTVTSATAITVTPIVARTSASGLRYRISSTGDVITCGGCSNTAITGNTIRYSHDIGINVGQDLFFGSFNPSFNMTVAGNVASFVEGVGLYVSGISECTVTGNSFNNNGQAGSAVAANNRVGILIDNSSANGIVKFCHIFGNNLSDNQATHTQQYGISILGSQGTGNILGANEADGNATGDMFTASATTLATSFAPASFALNALTPAESPRWVYGPTCNPASCAGDFGVLGDNTHYVAMGYFVASNYGWIQSANNGNSDTPLRLNPAGQPVGLSTPATFASLPACGASSEGFVQPVTDSTVNTWGTAIAGSGTNHVLAYCDGTSWTVAAK